MTKPRIILFSTTLLIVLLVLFVLIKGHYSKKTSEPEPGKVEDIEFILIKNAFGFEPTGIHKPNAAMLLTDKKEIIEDQMLFLSDRVIMMSMNGCDYNIQFWKNDDSIVHDIGIDVGITSFSYKSDVADQKLYNYISQLEKRPTHYIYNLSVSTDQTPINVKRILKDSGYRILFIDDTLSRYPEIGFSFKHDMIIPNKASLIESKSVEKENDIIIKETIQRIINKIRAVGDVINQSDFFYTSGGIYENREDSETHVSSDYSVYLRLEQEIDTLTVLKIIKNEGAIPFGLSVPHRYNIQLIDTISDIKQIKIKLKDYTIIKKISEYSDPNK